MGIYLCGDIHGTLDLEKITKWEKECNPTEKDTLICLGDWGAIWYGDERDQKLINYWDNKPYQFLFVDGNHENHIALNNYPVVYYCGGKCHLIGNSIKHLMRGEVYTIEDKTFFTMGGANSIDKWMRTRGKSWWEEEVPSNGDYINATYNLEEIGFEVDYMLTHCTDNGTLKLIDKNFESDALGQFLFRLKDLHILKYKHHYFGHYHIDAQITDKETCLYQKIIELK